jgi:hypothetical protein
LCSQRKQSNGALDEARFFGVCAGVSGVSLSLLLADIAVVGLATTAMGLAAAAAAAFSAANRDKFCACSNG